METCFSFNELRSLILNRAGWVLVILVSYSSSPASVDFMYIYFWMISFFNDTSCISPFSFPFIFQCQSVGNGCEKLSFYTICYWYLQEFEKEFRKLETRNIGICEGEWVPPKSLIFSVTSACESKLICCWYDHLHFIKWSDLIQSLTASLSRAPPTQEMNSFMQIFVCQSFPNWEYKSWHDLIWWLLWPDLGVNYHKQNKIGEGFQVYIHPWTWANKIFKMMT